MVEVPDAAKPSNGSLNVQISNLVVRLLSERTGRGPTKARTHISDDLITTVLTDTLTKGERSLVSEGQTSLVRANRKAFQEMISAELAAGVEQLSGRSVVAVLSDDQIEPDIAVQAIILEPLQKND